MEHLLHEERKQKDRESDAKQRYQDDDSVRAAVTRTRRSVRCYNCRKMGHIKWICPLNEKPQYRKRTANAGIADTNTALDNRVKTVLP